MNQFKVGDIVECTSRNYSAIKYGDRIRVDKVNDIYKPYPYKYSPSRNIQHIVGTVISSGSRYDLKIGSKNHGFSSENFKLVESASTNVSTNVSTKENKVSTIKFWAVNVSTGNRIGATSEEVLVEKLQQEFLKNPVSEYDVFEYSYTAKLPTREFVKEVKNFDVA